LLLQKKKSFLSSVSEAKVFGNKEEIWGRGSKTFLLSAAEIS
jgi:hypothetical protein